MRKRLCWRPLVDNARRPVDTHKRPSVDPRRPSVRADDVCPVTAALNNLNDENPATEGCFGVVVVVDSLVDPSLAGCLVEVVVQPSPVFGSQA